MCALSNFLHYNSYDRGVIHHATAGGNGGCCCCRYSAFGHKSKYASRGVDRRGLLAGILAIVRGRVQLVLRTSELLSTISDIPRRRVNIEAVSSRVTTVITRVRECGGLGTELCRSCMGRSVSRSRFGRVGKNFARGLRATRQAGTRLRRGGGALLSHSHAHHP